MAIGNQGSYVLSSRPGGVSYVLQSTPSLNTTFDMSLRQHMDESNLELVNVLTKQIGVPSIL